MINNKKYYVDLILLLFLASAIGTLGYISYFSNEEVQFSPQSALFEIPSSVEYLFIDQNLEFLTPEKILTEDKLVLEFEEGVYYLKIPLEDRNDIRMFNIGKTKVKLIFILDEFSGKYTVSSVSEVNLKVDVSQYGETLGSVVIGDAGLEGEKVEIIGGESE